VGAGDTWMRLHLNDNADHIVVEKATELYVWKIST
jgi:hypothetical protein